MSEVGTPQWLGTPPMGNPGSATGLYKHRTKINTYIHATYNRKAYMSVDSQRGANLCIYKKKRDTKYKSTSTHTEENIHHKMYIIKDRKRFKHRKVRASAYLSYTLLVYEIFISTQLVYALNCRDERAWN